MKYLKMFEKRTEISLDLQYIDDLMVRIKTYTHLTKIEYNFSKNKISLNIKLSNESLSSLTGMEEIEEYSRNLQKIVSELKRVTVFVEERGMEVYIDLCETNEMWIVIIPKNNKNHINLINIEGIASLNMNW